MKLLAHSFLVAITLFGLALSGCGSTNSKPTAEPTEGQEPTGGKLTMDQGPVDPSRGEQGQSDSATTDMAKMKATLAKMDPEDAASAAEQHMCPVSGEMLGTMGLPQKVTVKGRTVWLCCNGCKDKLLADPDKYLAKLDQSH